MSAARIMTLESHKKWNFWQSSAVFYHPIGAIIQNTVLVARIGATRPIWDFSPISSSSIFQEPVFKASTSIEDRDFRLKSIHLKSGVSSSSCHSNLSIS